MLIQYKFSKAHIPLQTGLNLCWVTNANQMSTNNMKCTCPTQKFWVGDPTQPIFHWLVWGFCFRGNANFMFRVGGNANFSVFRYQHNGIPMQNTSYVGSSHWLRPQTQGPIVRSRWSFCHNVHMRNAFIAIK